MRTRPGAAVRLKRLLVGRPLATDLADGLVVHGVPFREAHHIVGRLVRAAEEAKAPLNRLPEATSRTIHPKLPGLIASLGTWEDSVERRATAGGSARASVLEQIRVLERAFSLEV